MAEKILYHASTVLFNTIDVSYGQGYTDFGPGFYTAPNKKHSIIVAKEKKAALISEAKILGLPVSNIKIYLYTFSLNTSLLNTCRYLEFKQPTREWAKFVLTNRETALKLHKYDVIVGPAADAGFHAVLNEYRMGKFGSVGSDVALDKLIIEFKTWNLSKQWYFGSNLIAQQLIRKGAEII